MGNLCTSMSADDLKAAKMSKEVDQASEAAFKKVGEGGGGMKRGRWDG
jgi:hypothetical protein